MKSAGQILEGISLVWWPTVLRSLSEVDSVDVSGTETAKEGHKLQVASPSEAGGVSSPHIFKIPVVDLCNNPTID
jgi:hypothetical protein